MCACLSACECTRASYFLCARAGARYNSACESAKFHIGRACETGLVCTIVTREVESKDKQTQGKTSKDRQRQAKTGKDKKRQAKTSKDKQRQAKTGKDKQRQAKTGKDRQRQA